MMRAREDADLRWFFRWSEGELGLRSNFGSMVERLRLGLVLGSGMTNEDGWSEQRIRAAHRARMVRRALERMHTDQVRVLYDVFGIQCRGLILLGRVAALTLRLAPNPAHVVEVHWTAAKGDRVASQEIRRLRLESEGLLHEARLCYRRNLCP